MATFKAYTDIEQSRKLAKFLPLESADMYYDRGGLPSLIDKYVTHESIKNDKYHHLIPCWSLAALLGIIRETIGYTIYGVNNVYMSCNLGDQPWKLETEVYDNEVDACVDMIIKLYEMDLL